MPFTKFLGMWIALAVEYCRMYSNALFYLALAVISFSVCYMLGRKAGRKAREYMEK